MSDEKSNVISKPKQIDCDQEFKFLLEAVNDAVIRLDDAGRIIYANTKITSITGYNIGQIKGIHITDLYRELMGLNLKLINSIVVRYKRKRSNSPFEILLTGVL